MGSWAASDRKLSMSAKVSLFVGDGPATAYLVQRVVGMFDRAHYLHPPISVDDLSSVVGLPSQTQATVISPVEELSESQWEMVRDYLRPTKVPGTTLVLSGSSLPDSPAAQKVKELAGRGRNVYAQAVSPTGAKSRDEMINWVAETWQIFTADADYACARADFDLTALVWATHTFRVLTGGGDVPSSSRARQLIDIAVPASPVADALTTILHRAPMTERVRSVHGFTQDQTTELLRQLERMLFDIESCRPYVVQRASPGKVAKDSGLHIARVKELLPLVQMYSVDVQLRCREVLSVGFEHQYEPECAETVAMLWG